MKKAFVTGWPISQSKSPMLHGFWLEQYGIEGSYEAVGVEPENFKRFLQKIPEGDYLGGNVTLPHKEVAFSVIANLDEAAKKIGAVNTLWLEEGKLHGGNTDAYGFSANMDQHAPEWKEGKTALVLGAGGASRAIVFSILQAGYERIDIVNRTLSRAKTLVEVFGDKCSAHEWDKIHALLPDADLVVNTTSIGMAGSNTTTMPNLDTARKSSIITDIVYTPLETPFLKAAKMHDLKTVDGLGMLLHQAVPGFEKWFGIRPEVTDELRNYILGLSS
jgi:shikimate dehydrogenase